MLAAGYPLGFYVYQLVDPRDGLPFYVGKGQGARAWQHERDVRAGRKGANPRKVSKIENILRVGRTVEVRIVAEYDLESDALDHEYRLVDSLPTLTNAVAGGGGPIRSEMTAAQLERHAALVERRRKHREAKLAELRAKEREEAVKRDVERKRAEFLQGAETPEDIAAINKWVDAQAASSGGRISLAPERALKAVPASPPRSRGAPQPRPLLKAGGLYGRRR